MKVIFQKLLLIVCMTAMAFPAFSQNAEQKWGLGVGYTGRDFTGIPNQNLNNTKFYPAFHVYLARYLNPSFDLNLESGIVPFSFGETNPQNKDLFDVDLILRYKLNNGYIFREEASIAPYLLAGGSVNTVGFNDPAFNPSIPLGIGFKINTGIPVTLDFNGTYKMNVGDFQDYFAANAGVVFNFGKFEPKDTDGDGIVDDEDACPLVAGLPDLQGCPDRDGDGIADDNDNCPDEAGLAEFAGCPDPDRDKDGVLNDADECPDVAGVASLNGCPDRDGDGITDLADACPDEAGPASTNGCPDKDGDGILDRVDDCPDVAGTADLNGCPDRDGDGITDAEDACPDEAGTVELKGCPEIEEEVIEKLEFATKAVQFETNSSILKKSSYAVLDTLVAVMNDYPAYSLRASGHTDSQGDDKYNLWLSERRAKACVDYISEQGIDPERLVHIGYGETQPITDNITSAGRATNRRVEFELFVK